MGLADQKLLKFDAPIQRDAQRSKVYKWEGLQLDPGVYGRNLSAKEFDYAMEAKAQSLEACVEQAKALMGRRVKVLDGRGRMRACAYWTTYPTIALPKWSRQPWIVCHEVAHLVVMRIDTTLPPHGGIFMREYIRLLDQAGLGSTEELTASAKAAGIRVTKPSK